MPAEFAHQTLESGAEKASKLRYKRFHAELTDHVQIQAHHGRARPPRERRHLNRVTRVE